MKNIVFETKIKEYRAKLNLTQENLAKVVGVSRETIVHIEKGKYNPSLKLAFSISQALKTSINEIFIFKIADS